MVNITAKSWGYSEEDKCEIYTGNYKITAPYFTPKTDYWSEKVYGEIEFEIVTICQIGKALTKLRDDPEVNFEATDEEIVKLWNEQIVFHNENHELFIKKFSLEHKDFYVNLTRGYGSFFFTQDMVVENREKALKIVHPIVGTQWIPKGCVYTIFDKPEKRTPAYLKYLEKIMKENKPVEEYYVTAYSYNSFRNL